MDFLGELGHLALASRLKRLAERLQQQVSAVYAEQEIGFRARWFPVLAALAHKDRQPVSRLAACLGLTHTAIAQIAHEMEGEGLLLSAVDANDGRHRLLALTPKGNCTLARLRPLWDEIRGATEDLVAEAGHDLLTGVAAVEQRLTHQSMAERLRARLGKVEVVGWRPELAPAFAQLNLAWIEPLFGVEEADRRVLDDPDGEVIAQGGEVLFALAGGQPVGTCALLRHGDAIELAKLAVAEGWRGRGIGRQLVVSALERSRALGARTLFVLTSPQLEAAVGLYRSLGLQLVAVPPVPHTGLGRSSIVLRLDLQKETP